MKKMFRIIMQLLCCLCLANVYAQIGFEEYIVNAGLDGPVSIDTADIDVDGDLDVVAASFPENQIAWFENLDGQGENFAWRQVTTITGGPISVDVSDLDGDGDMDILVMYREDKIAWYENMDGSGNFSTQQVVSSSIVYGSVARAADLDGDGDMDVLSASFLDDKIAWYENIDGQATFGPQQILSTNLDGAIDVYPADLDGDGDLDVLGCGRDESDVVWFENLNGTGSFGAEQLVSTGLSFPRALFAVDLDGDGDLDVLSASSGDSKIAWYDNLGGGNFGNPTQNQNIITTDAQGAYDVYSADLDGDGDQDVLSVSRVDNKIAWYENIDGQGSFGEQQIIKDSALGLWAVVAADINDDGKIDVLSCSEFDYRVNWFKNLGVLGIAGTKDQSVRIYPNPTSGVVSLAFENELDNLELLLTNVQGQLISQKVFETLSNTEIELPSTAGVYFLTLKTSNGQSTVKLIKQ